MKEKSKQTVYFVEGICCVEDEFILKKKLNGVAGVKDHHFNLITKKLSVLQTCPDQQIIETLKKAGFSATTLDNVENYEIKTAEWKKYIFLLLSGSLLLTGLILNNLKFSENVLLVFFALSAIVGGWKIAIKGIKSVISMALDMNFLMFVAAIGGFIIGEYAEAAAVIFMFSIALYLESLSLERTRKAIRSLMNLSPTTAYVKERGSEILKPVKNIKTGEMIKIRPGEQISLDGIITNGISSINESLITGESSPVLKQEGDQVFAGTINLRGSFEFKVVKEYHDTMLSKIVEMIEKGQSEKADSQTFIEKFSKIYTPAVTIIAILIAVIPPLFFSAPFEEWFYRSLVMLVIACPCALVISTPVTIVTGITQAARNGVLIKGGKYLEAIGKQEIFAIDKTGTLTEGRPKLQEIITLNSSAVEKILQIAAAIENHSEHPLAEAVEIKAVEAGISFRDIEVKNFLSFPGRGITAQIGDKIYMLGNHLFCEENNLCSADIENILEKLESEGKTVIVVIENEIPMGIISFIDVAREESKKAIHELKQIGIKNILMITGDNEKIANTVAKEIGIDKINAGLMPEEKLNIVLKLKEQNNRVCVIGDGVNDAPALAASTVGIAMGSIGTDVAIETSNIVLHSENLMKVVDTIKLSKKTNKILKQNIVLALITKGVFLILGAFGLATLWMAILADDGAAIAVIFNGLRLLKK